MPYEKKALDNISFSINQGEFVGIIGKNGSGKSTLIQHFNGLLCPTAGRVMVYGKDTRDQQVRNELWKKVGLVFQFSEHQIFEENVFDEVAYGLKNMGLTKNEIELRVGEALDNVGLDVNEVGSISPLRLSGGMRKRVALACIFAMQPPILVLDEPLAGLDPVGREQIIKMIKNYQETFHATVIMVSHHINELILCTERILLLDKGKLLGFGKVQDIFEDPYLQNIYHAALPDYLKLIYELKRKGKHINTNIYTIEEVELELDRLLRELKNERN